MADKIISMFVIYDRIRQSNAAIRNAIENKDTKLTDDKIMEIRELYKDGSALCTNMLKVNKKIALEADRAAAALVAEEAKLAREVEDAAANVIAANTRVAEANAAKAKGAVVAPVSTRAPLKRKPPSKAAAESSSSDEDGSDYEYECSTRGKLPRSCTTTAATSSTNTSTTAATSSTYTSTTAATPSTSSAALAAHLAAAEERFKIMESENTAKVAAEAATYNAAAAAAAKAKADADFNAANIAAATANNIAAAIAHTNSIAAVNAAAAAPTSSTTSNTPTAAEIAHTNTIAAFNAAPTFSMTSNTPAAAPTSSTTSNTPAAASTNTLDMGGMLASLPPGGELAIAPSAANDICYCCFNAVPAVACSECKSGYCIECLAETVCYTLGERPCPDCPEELRSTIALVGYDDRAIEQVA